MTDPVTWFLNHILPYLTIALLGGAWGVFRKVDKLQNGLTALTKDYDVLAKNVQSKYREVDDRLKNDVDELKSQIDYLTRNNITRDELNQYLTQLNLTVNRLADTIDKFL